MQKKIRSNREYEDIFALAAHLNYYFQRNPDAQLTMNDLKKIVDRNPSFCLEEQTINNGFQRPLISDSDGHTLSLVMAPRFYVFDDEVEDGDPEDEEELPEEEVYEDSEDTEDTEDTEEESEEAEVEDIPEEEDSGDVAEGADEDEVPFDDRNEYARKFSGLREDDKVYWRDPETRLVHEAEVVAIGEPDGKVADANTEITVSIEGMDGVTVIFPDEILDEDDIEELGDDEFYSSQTCDSESCSDNDGEDDD